MRSKSVAARPKGEDKAEIRIATGCTLHVAGALSLVRGADAQPARAMKPGLY